VTMVLRRFTCSCAALCLGAAVSLPR
jgi:hypothetical protein